MKEHNSQFESLIQQCVRKNNAAQKELYDLFSAQMFNICLRYTKNRSQAEDVFQEGFIKVFENINSLKSPKALASWVKTIFVHTAINHCHYEKEKWNHSEITQSNGQYFDFDILDELAYEELVELINELPEKTKIVFNLYVVEGYTHHEIAEIMGTTIGTSKSQLFDARQNLKSKIAASNVSHLKIVI